MTRIQKVAVVAVFAAVACTTVAAAEDGPATSGFRVESARIDVGEIVSGSEGSATFVFRNDTDADVRILRAKPS